MNASFRLSALALALASVSSQAAEPASDQLPSGVRFKRAKPTSASQSPTDGHPILRIERSLTGSALMSAPMPKSISISPASARPHSTESIANPTQVMGRITAPGQVFLVNPNGVLFGPNSQVDVGGLPRLRWILITPILWPGICASIPVRGRDRSPRRVK